MVWGVSVSVCECGYWKREKILAVAEGVAGGADFCGEDLKDLEGEALVAGHDGEELFTGDEAEDGAGVCDGGEGT